MMRIWRLESKSRFKQRGAASAEEALLRLLETQEELDRWLLENMAAINAKNRRGIEQLAGAREFQKINLTPTLPSSKPSAG